MIIERNIWEIKAGCVDQAISILKTEKEEHFPSIEARVLQPVFAPFDTIVTEIQFNSLSEADTFWSQWWESGAAAAFSQKFDPLTTGKGSREAWNIHEPVKLARTGKYVNWRQSNAQPGKVGEKLDLLVKTRGDSNRYTILNSNYGTSTNRVGLVFEFDSLDAYLQEWEDWGREQATPEFWEAWFRVATEGGVNEVWQVA